MKAEDLFLCQLTLCIHGGSKCTAGDRVLWENCIFLKGESKLYKNMASSPYPPPLSFDSSVSCCKVFKKKSQTEESRGLKGLRKHIISLFCICLTLGHIHGQYESFDFTASMWGGTFPIDVSWKSAEIKFTEAAAFTRRLKENITLLTYCTLTFGQSLKRTGLFTQWISVGY